MAAEVVMPQHGYARIRRWPRYKIDVPVRVVVQKPEKTVIVNGRGLDLNEGGMAIFAGAELRVGQRIDIEFTPPYGQPQRVRCVISDRNGYKYGCEFQLVSREDKLQAEQIHHVLQALGSAGANCSYSCLRSINQTRHLAQIRGKGQLSRSGEPDVPVTYDLDVYEERIDAEGGDFISGRREIEGRITSKHRAVRGFSATNGEPSVLKLQDGRKLRILVLDSHGSVLGAGGFFE